MTTRPLRLVVAINPQASFDRGRTVGPRVVERLRASGHQVEALVEPDFERLRAAASTALGLAGAAPATTGSAGPPPGIPAAPESATPTSGVPATATPAEPPDALVVVGGDGMVNLAVGLVAGTGIPFGLVPSGTGNDMARGLGIPVGDTEAAIDALLEALGRPPRTIDAGRIRRTDGTVGWYGAVLSAGFDAIVNERANLMRWPRGRQRYNLALLRELALLKPLSYELEVDGVERRTDAVLVAVANNQSLGGGMRIAPEASLDDGLLDVFVVEPLSRTAFLRIFPRVFKGTHVSDPRVSLVRAKRIRIQASGVVAYADGERVGPLPVEVEVVAGALKVLAPPAVAATLPA